MCLTTGYYTKQSLTRQQAIELLAQHGKGANFLPQHGYIDLPRQTDILRLWGAWGEYYTTKEELCYRISTGYPMSGER